jgi:hypothetical protein
MTRSPALRRASWEELAQFQSGVISRGQLLGLGLTAAQARADVETGRWVSHLPGVYTTFTGPIGTLTRIWAALLYAGRGAAASHRTALWLWKLVDDPPTVIDFVVPENRKILPQKHLRVHRRRSHSRDFGAAGSLIHPSAQPPRLRVEEAILDMAGTVTAPELLDLLLRATQRRLTTAQRLRASVNRRPRVRWRSLLLGVLADIEDGVASPLEQRYLRDVERRHHLPTGSRNLMEVRGFGGRWYRDVRYEPWRVVVELDGREAHPAESWFRDMDRDNRAAFAGEQALRYGWREVVNDPCHIASQVGSVLTHGGWPGLPRPCGVDCAVLRSRQK